VRRPPVRAPIRGVVVDESGAAVGGVVVTGNAHEWHRYREAARTPPDGRFELARPDAAENDSELHVLLSQSRRLVVVAPTGRVAWGTDDVRLVVRGLQRLVVRATSDGVPVERFSLRCQQEGHCADWQQALVPGRHAGGVAAIDGVPPGKSWLAVFPEDERLWQSEPLSIDVGPSIGVVEVHVPRRTSLDVEVLDALGAAVAGCEVEFLHAPKERPTSRTGVVELSKAALHDLLGVPGNGRCVLLARATTDAQGRARVGERRVADAYLMFGRPDGVWHGYARVGADGAFVAWLPDGTYRVSDQRTTLATGELVVRGPMPDVDLVLTRQTSTPPAGVGGTAGR
jgi:hypothetical protein